MEIRRGDIVLVNLDPVIGSAQGRTRPALIIQNDIGNQNSPTTIIAPITTRIYSKEYPTNVRVDRNESGLDHDSTILLNQIRTVDRSRIVRKLSSLRSGRITQVERAIKASLGIE